MHGCGMGIVMQVTFIFWYTEIPSRQKFKTHLMCLKYCILLTRRAPTITLNSLQLAHNQKNFTAQ